MRSQLTSSLINTGRSSTISTRDRPSRNQRSEYTCNTESLLPPNGVGFYMARGDLIICVGHWWKKT